MEEFGTLRKMRERANGEVLPPPLSLATLVNLKLGFFEWRKYLCALEDDVPLREPIWQAALRAGNVTLFAYDLTRVAYVSLACFTKSYDAQRGMISVLLEELSLKTRDGRSIFDVPCDDPQAVVFMHDLQQDLNM